MIKSGIGQVAEKGQPGELMTATDHLRSMVRLEVRHRALVDTLREIYAQANQGEAVIAELVNQAVTQDAMLKTYKVEQMVAGEHLSREEWAGARDKQGPPYVVNAEDYHAPPSDEALKELVESTPAPPAPSAPETEFPEGYPEEPQMWEGVEEDSDASA